MWSVNGDALMSPTYVPPFLGRAPSAAALSASTPSSTIANAAMRFITPLPLSKIACATYLTAARAHPLRDGTHAGGVPVGLPALEPQRLASQS